MRATVILISHERMCSARTDNQILFVFALPTDTTIHLSDELNITNPSLDDVLRITNVTCGTSFDVKIAPNNVHDLRLPMAHGTSRTPSMARLKDADSH